MRWIVRGCATSRGSITRTERILPKRGVARGTAEENANRLRVMALHAVKKESLLTVGATIPASFTSTFGTNTLVVRSHPPDGNWRIPPVSVATHYQLPRPSGMGWGLRGGSLDEFEPC